MASVLAMRLASSRHAAPQLQRSMPLLPGLMAPSRHCSSISAVRAAHCSSSGSGGSRSPAAAACSSLQWPAHHPRQHQLRRQRHASLIPAASFTVVTGDSGDGSSGGSSAPWRLIIYSKEGCCLCDGLKEKIEALLDRAAFMPSAMSAAELELRDITTNPEWEGKYAMSIPVLAAAAADGSVEVEVPRPSPRLSADALQRHIEKFLEQQPQLRQA